MTNLVDRLPLPPRADGVAASEPGHPEVLRGVRSGVQTRGLTLIEMLVALAVTLVMMAAVVNLFANMSASIRNRRAAIETGSQLRQVRNRLAMDLSGATCRGSTWQDPAENQGYIEIIEGQWSDKNPSDLILPGNVNTNNGIDTTISLIPSSQAFDSDSGDAAAPSGVVNLGAGAVTDGRALGDWDDVLALTVRSESDPFVAPVGGAMVESPLAEVVWFAREQGPSTPPNPNDGFRRIYRRVLLIAPWLGPFGTNIADPPENVSAHWDPTLNSGNGQWVANTLGDLTKRENRAFHAPNTSTAINFPNRFVAGTAYSTTNQNKAVLENALGFDLRVFDPGAPLVTASGQVLEPNDIGWPAAISAGSPVISGYGAYCDLGWGFNPFTSSMAYLTAPSGAPLPQFSEVRPAGYHWISSPQSNSISQYPAVYDTWSYHYENDGIDQDQLWQTNAQPWQLNNIDQGANGLDDNNANGVDDRGERETSPPYDVPLRGVKVILRVYEPDSRQIRESSVTHSFKQ